MRRLLALLAVGIIGCSNPSTPAQGYISGYVTKHPYTMPGAGSNELQTGPTSTGLGWKCSRSDQQHLGDAEYQH